MHLIPSTKYILRSLVSWKTETKAFCCVWVSGGKHATAARTRWCRGLISCGGAGSLLITAFDGIGRKCHNGRGSKMTGRRENCSTMQTSKRVLGSLPGPRDITVRTAWSQDRRSWSAQTHHGCPWPAQPCLLWALWEHPLLRVGARWSSC